MSEFAPLEPWSKGETLKLERKLWQKFPRSSKPEFFLLALIAAVSAWLWLHLFAPIFQTGFMADDSIFLAVSPPSLHDIANWFLVPVDDSGYYRPFSRVLWSLMSAMGATTPGEFQIATLCLLFGAGFFLFLGLKSVHSNLSLAVAGSVAFVFSLAHAKSLFWITVWFNTASAFFASATFAFFCMAAKSGSVWQRRAGLVCLAGAYASNNAMHSMGIVPLAIDFVFLCRYEEESGLSRFRRLLWRAKDHLLVSASFFLFIYGCGHPFSRTSQFHIHLFDIGNFRGLLGYVTASFWHPFGDGPMPAILENPLEVQAVTLGVMILFVFGFLWDRTFLIFSSLLVGTAFVISLLHDRWEVEYAAPVALGVAALISAGLAGVCTLLPLGKKAVSYALCAGWIYCSYQFALEGMPAFARDYLRDTSATAEFMRSIRELDQKLPRGRVFLFKKMEGPNLGSAPFGHFMGAAFWEMLPGRAYLLRPGIFISGEGMGMQDENGSWANENLNRAKPYIEILCGPGGCREGTKSD